MTKHTPGPWTITGQSTTYITVKSAGGRTVARVPFSREDDASPTDASDAALIAAIPELLAVVQYVAATGHAAAAAMACAALKKTFTH